MKHTEKKLLYKDCMKFTRIPCLIYLVQECGEGLVSVFIATLIGSFADAVFVLDMQYAIANMWRLIICLCFTVIFVPILTIIADIQCFKNTLRYERKLLSRFFEKDYADAMQYEYGEVSQRLEDDSIEFRYNIINIFTKTVTSVAMLVALLIMALPSSPAFTVIVFIISLVKLIVPIAVRKLDKKYDTLTREYNEHITSIEMELTTKPHIVKMMGIDAPFRKKLEYGSPSLEIKTNLNSAALYPVNAMGTSKAMMEKVIVAKSRTVSPDRTKICCTRYGNVMCSRGSVIPLWIEPDSRRTACNNYRRQHDTLYYVP